MYLCLVSDKDMADLPEEQIKLIGKYTHAMELDLNTRKKLLNVDRDSVKASLNDRGYHVQLPRHLITDVLKHH